MMLKNRWKKAACLILTIISTVCLGKVDVKAADYWPDAPETLSPGVILMEESTGTILYEKNMDEAPGKYHKDHDHAAGVGKW